MPEGSEVQVTLDGAHLRVDARPSRLVSLLRGGGGDPVVTTRPETGDAVSSPVPEAARQVTVQIEDELTVEATRASDFVALAEAGGRRVVVAFTGEVTVLPAGPDGDRFALGAHEALLVESAGAEPRVVPSDSLSDDDQDEISAAMEAAALGVAAAAPKEAAPKEPVKAAATEKAAPAQKSAPQKSAAPKGETAKGPAVTPPGGGKRGKKGKRARPQPQTKKQAPLVPAAAAGAGAAAAATTAAAASGAKKTTPAKKAGATKAPATKTTKAAKTAPGKGGGGGNQGGGGGHDDSYEDTPADRRFIIAAVAVAAVVAVLLAVFVFRSGDDTTDLAADDTTTTAAPATTTTAAVTTSAPAVTPTTVAATTTAKATSTTAPATTTTAKATTTTAAAPAVKYAIEPKSCVQNADKTITYTATITNQSTVPFDYTVRVAFKDDKGASAASSDAKVNLLAAGKSVDFTAKGTPSRSLVNVGSCDVEQVDAKPSGS